MAKIVAFTMGSIDDGGKALERLEEVEQIEDVALVYRNEKGRVKLRQTSDVSAGRGAVRGALLGATVGLVTGPVVGVAAVGAAAGGLVTGLGDRGVDDKLMKLAGEGLESGQSAVFVLTDDPTADEITAEIRRRSGLEDADGEPTVVDFPADAQELVKERIKAQVTA